MSDRFWEGRRVLITGIQGFIGAWLASTLLERGASIFGYDRADRGALDLHSGLRRQVSLALGDLTDQSTLESALVSHGIETAYHLAAQSNISVAKGSPVAAFDSNIRGSWTFLDACRANGRLATIVVASSNTVYGEQETAPFSEELPLNANNPYAASKACTDILTRCYAASYGLPVAVARATNTYGGADPNVSRIVPGTILNLLDGQAPVIKSDGSPQKGYLYVKDTANAYRLLGERAADADVRGRAFNFHPERPVSVLDLVTAMVKISDRADLQPVVQGAAGKYEFEFLSSDRARQVLGWQPQYSLEAGLRETYQWYRAAREAEAVATGG
jgi:CDP-glucose 4,6-dehydratase